MFVPLEEARWPEAGEVRDLRISLNAPVLLGARSAEAEARPLSDPTRAALGWQPAEDEASRVRLWLRSESGAEGAEGVRGFEFRERPVGPAARARAVEAAENYLAGLGFLFPDAEAAAATATLDAAFVPIRPMGVPAEPRPAPWAPAASPGEPADRPEPRGSRPSVPAPLDRRAIRPDGPLAKFRARPSTAAEPGSHRSPGFLGRLVRSLGFKSADSGGVQS